LAETTNEQTSNLCCCFLTPINHYGYVWVTQPSKQTKQSTETFKASWLNRKKKRKTKRKQTNTKQTNNNNTT